MFNSIHTPLLYVQYFWNHFGTKRCLLLISTIIDLQDVLHHVAPVFELIQGSILGDQFDSSVGFVRRVKCKVSLKLCFVYHTLGKIATRLSKH